MINKTHSAFFERAARLKTLTHPFTLLATSLVLAFAYFIIRNSLGKIIIENSLLIVGMASIYEIVRILLGDYYRPLKLIPIYFVVAAIGITVGAMTELVVGAPFGVGVSIEHAEF